METKDYRNCLIIMYEIHITDLDLANNVLRLLFLEIAKSRSGIFLYGTVSSKIWVVFQVQF